MACFHPFRFYIPFPRDFVASKHYGSLQKTNQKFIVDECASHVTLFSIQPLSLELAALAIRLLFCLGSVHSDVKIS